MMISVCIPTYNGEQYIEEQLQSILIQLGDEDEVIISDDHSADGTLEKIRNLADARIVVIENSEHRGLIHNIEIALHRARGETIYLADQDDIWFPDKVATVQPLMAHNDLVLHDAVVVDAAGNLLTHSFFASNHSGRGFFRNWVNNSFMGCCMAFRRQVLEYVLPFPENIVMHDSWIGLNAILRGKYSLINQPLIYYRRHGANTIKSLKKTHLPITYQVSYRLKLMQQIIKRRRQ